MPGTCLPGQTFGKVGKECLTPMATKNFAHRHILLCFPRIKQDCMLHVWFTCLSDFEDKESHRSIFLLYSPIFLFPNLQFTGGFRSARDTMSVFLVTFLFKQSKGGQNLAHYLSLWAVCLCLITLAQTRTFFFKWKSLSLLAPPILFYSIVDCNPKLWQVRHLLLSGLSVPSNEQPSARKCSHHL